MITRYMNKTLDIEQFLQVTKARWGEERIKKVDPRGIILMRYVRWAYCWFPERKDGVPLNHGFHVDLENGIWVIMFYTHHEETINLTVRMNKEPNSATLQRFADACDWRKCACGT